MKRLTVCSLLLCAMLLLGGTASAVGLYDAAFYREWSGVTYNNVGKVHFYGGTKATGAYGTASGKIIKQAYVRLVEGDYDSGRVYTAIGTRTWNGVDYSKTIKKSYNPAKVCQGYYGWLYY